ncbi:class I SAM-dependent methyltransferase [Protaetiibacter sp. SSC-01]|uniref:class I SAM-dependent methyltransferase n=1 Tax=Protaetiibacter sp. SSC-01 TaxID=2759943 RepID=UPI0016573652|nr:class I SAM-dependent methyltransferase [Protaetiibacter sp. SSC-01]QNO36865.1 class I SAM-dependent methyltransferase [Protaetiibacter sp. SSC-01]
MSTPVVQAALRRATEWERLALSEIGDGQAVAAFAIPPTYLLEAVRSVDEAESARLRREMRERSDSPSALLTDRFVRWLLRRNQFLPLDPRTRRRIQDTYDRGFLRALRLHEHATRRDLAGLIEDHGNALRSLVTDITGGAPRDVVSGEYSPATQLAVLGLTMASVRGPVLDIGSGEHALLVHHLRSAGVEAHGIDHLADGAMQADWLTFDPGRNRWATITAHHSFTLHFRHHHHRADAGDTASAYAEAFMRYLFALEVGGTFAYAPAVPFFEALLPPDRWLARPTARILNGVTTTSTQITRRY